MGDAAVVATPTNGHGGADDVVSIKVRAILAHHVLNLDLASRGLLTFALVHRVMYENAVPRGGSFFRRQLTNHANDLACLLHGTL